MTSIKNKEWLITGGTGTLGKTIVKIILEKYAPKGIRIYSRDEFKQWVMREEFSGYKNISYLIGDIRDEKRLTRAMEGTDFVIHTAAMKQVPSCEENPIEAIQTNTMGAVNLINAAINAKVKRFMNVSTDKGVYPVNLYGVSKAAAEKLFIFGNTYSPGRTLFSCCRYGNVIGSRGSIIPLFIDQYSKNKTLTITHPDMTRYWVTIDFVANFIVSNVAEMEGGEIFIPKMKSMSVMDLAKGLFPDMKYKITGIRQGEKLHEVLISMEESMMLKESQTLYIIHPKYYNKEASGMIYSSQNADKMSIEEFKELSKWKGI